MARWRLRPQRVSLYGAFTRSIEGLACAALIVLALHGILLR